MSERRIPNRMPPGALNGSVPLLGQQQQMISLKQIDSAFPVNCIIPTQTGQDVFVSRGLTPLQYAAIHLGGDVDKALDVLKRCQAIENPPADGQRTEQISE